MTPVQSIEGIHEFRLANGLQVLLIPDPSKALVTVNMTVLVGSRHEGYGEAGMAHLLEHMLFKGTPNHSNIPELLKQRGASFNGTTWLDRTNYYETLPAATAEQSADNLRFALALEADRLINSHVSRDDLASEMTVVRNEFERGENNSRRILSQRVQSLAFDWHNYGRTTIGNLSDIERVPVEKLQDFYRKFYRPDNVVLVIAGRFDQVQTLAAIDETFGQIPAPLQSLDQTYTIEPPQDGERSIVLRRVGNTQFISAVYHVPCGADCQFAAIEMLAYIFGTEPTGRLYQSLVVPGLASSIATSSYGLHDAGMAKFEAQVPVGKSLDDARRTLLEAIESVGQNPVTEEELKRARSQFFKSRELRAADCTTIAVELSDWAAQGDWRLYFLFRDYVESLTVEDCTAAAVHYFTQNNRSLGLFIPSESVQRVEVPPRPDIAAVLQGYQGREAVAIGEAFDADPVAIESLAKRDRLLSGFRTIAIGKRTRGNSVCMDVNLRFGNESVLAPFVVAGDFLPELMSRGTRGLTYQQLHDRLDELQAEVELSGTNGLVSLSLETKRANLPEVLQLVGEILRYPSLEPHEFELLRDQAIAATESRLSEPNVLASVALRRALAPYPVADVRYVPTLEDRIERYRNLDIDQIQQLHASLLNGQFGELAIVGDFDEATMPSAITPFLDDWNTDVAYRRIDMPARTDLPADEILITTPDKPNAVYYAGMHLEMRDDDPDYPALVIGNHILGGSALTSRLGDRIRQREGMSYSVGSSLHAHSVDRRANFSLYAILNPSQRERLASLMREEMDRLLADGPTAAEVASAKEGYLQSEQLHRTDDANLVSMLASTIFANRDMRFHSQFESRISDLTPADVRDAMQRHLDPHRLIVVAAGDF